MSKKAPAPEINRAAKLATLVADLTEQERQAQAESVEANAAATVEPERPSKGEYLRAVSKAANEDAIDGGNRAAKVEAERQSKQAAYAEAMRRFQESTRDAADASERLEIIRARLAEARAQLDAEIREQARKYHAAAHERYARAIAEYMLARVELEATLNVCVGRQTLGFELLFPSYGIAPAHATLKLDKDGPIVVANARDVSKLIAERVAAIRADILRGE